MWQKVLVTGSKGYIGKNIVEKLSGEHLLLTPPHEELDLLDAVAVKKYLDENKIDVVVHCASRGVERLEGKQSKVVEENLRMFFNLIVNLPLYKTLINLGSGAEYDKRRNLRKIKEEDFGTSIPLLGYDLSKFVMGQYVKNSNENIKHLRFFCVFGKGEDYSQRFISRSICRNLLGLPIEISQNAFFDYLCVDDAVKIINHFIKNDSKENIYNIGVGKPVDLISIAETINQIADKKSEIIVKKEGLNREYSCDNSRLMKDLENFRFTALEESIRELYEYYRRHIRDLDVTRIK